MCITPLKSPAPWWCFGPLTSWMNSFTAILPFYSRTREFSAQDASLATLIRIGTATMKETSNPPGEFLGRHFDCTPENV